MYAIAETAQMTAVGFTNNTGSSVGATIVSSGTAHNEGGWISVGTSPATESTGCVVVIWNANNAFRGLLDIGLQSTNTDEIISDIMVDFNRQDQHAYYLPFPISIPSSTPLMARLRSSLGSASVNVAIICRNVALEEDEYTFVCETIGQDTTAGVGASAGRIDSGGSQVDAGTVAQTFGSWKELSASTAFGCVAAKIMIGNNVNTTYLSALAFHYQIGIGASGQEIVIMDGIFLIGDSASDSLYPTDLDFPFVVQAGSRVSVRAGSNTVDATDRLTQVIMYLFRPVR